MDVKNLQSSPAGTISIHGWTPVMGGVFFHQYPTVARQTYFVICHIISRHIIFYSVLFYYIVLICTIFEGSLEVKLPTIWTDEKQRWEESERREE